MKIDGNNVLPVCLCLFGFAVPVTIAAAETLLLIVLLLGLRLWVTRQARLPTDTPYLIPVLLFAAVAVGSLFWSERPEASLGRLHRLLFPCVILVMGMRFPDGEKLPCVWFGYSVVGFLLGVVTLGLSDLIRIPHAVNHGVAWFDAGNMRDPQMYLVGICLFVALCTCDRCRRWQPFLWFGLILSLVGILLHFKRGVWAALLLAVVYLSVMTRRWVIVWVMIGVSLGALSLPQVRDRIVDLQIVGEVRLGGRTALWTEVAPDVIAEKPFGLGWGAMRHEDLADRTAYVQPKLNHLHNNLLQVTAEVGWLGLFAWLYWMGTAVVMMVRLLKKSPSSSRVGRAIGIGVLCGMVGLLVNGMVEYNFGDSEVLLLFCLLMGWSEWMRDAGWLERNPVRGSQLG